MVTAAGVTRVVQTLPCPLEFPEKFFAANYFVTGEFVDLDDKGLLMLHALFQQVGGLRRVDAWHARSLIGGDVLVEMGLDAC